MRFTRNSPASLASAPSGSSSPPESGGRLPSFTPMRIGMRAAFAAATTARIFLVSRMLPGLRRQQSTPWSIAMRALRWSKWMSATNGMATCFLISPMARACLSSRQDSRTISQPTSSSSWICLTVASTSQVGVVHMLCTTTGAPPPTFTLPTNTGRDSRLGRGPTASTTTVLS